MKFKSTYNNLDLLTIPISLSYKDSYSYRTFVGATLTIIFFIIIIIYLIFQLYKVLTKSSFTIISNEYQNPKESIDFTNVPILFTLTDDIGNPIDLDPKLVEYSVILNGYVQNFDQNGNTNTTHIETNLEIERCDKLNNSLNFSLFKKYNISSFQCIKPSQNIIINGSYGDINGYTSLKISVKKCDILKENCYNTDYIDNILSYSRFTIVYLGYKTNFYDLNTKDIEQTIYCRSISLSPNILKRVFYYMTLVKYELYDNLFLNNKKEIIYYINRGMILENDEIKTKSYDKNTLGYFSFVYDGNIIEYKKKVEKILEAISYLGNLFNIALTIFKIINDYFSNKILFVDIFYKFFFEKKFKRSKTLHFDVSNFSILPNLNENENYLKFHSKTQNKSINSNFNSSVFLESVRMPHKNDNVISLLNIKNNHANKLKYNRTISASSKAIEKEKNNFIKKSKFYYLLPFCIIKNKKNLENLIFVKKIICNCFSLESFIEFIKVEKTIKSLEKDKFNDFIYSHKVCFSSNNLKNEIDKIFSVN